MRRILLIEDSKEFQHIVRTVLGNLCVLDCATSESEINKCLEASPDLILLDVMLPNMDGFQLCARLRNDERTHHIPIIFLTGKKETADKVLGFSLGADDYIVKPFEAQEFRARIEAKLKKAEASREGEDWIRRGDLKISTFRHLATLTTPQGETSLPLTPNEFKLLIVLTRQEGRVLTREQLLSQVWGDRGLHVTDRTVDKHISSLRQKLGPCSSYIETVPNTGYRFHSQANASVAKAGGTMK